jgi:SAM-dependent methyltransferase
MPRQDLQRAYTAKVAEREALEPAAWKLDRRQEFLEILHAEGRTQLLELGSGVGQDAAFFHSAGLATTAIDLTPANASATAAKGPSAAVADLLNLPYASASFPAAYSLNCFIHLPLNEWSLALAEAHRVLQPGAPFHFSVFGGRESAAIFEDDSYTPPRFFAFYSDEQLKSILAQNFRIESFLNREPDEDGIHTQTALLRTRKDLP